MEQSPLPRDNRLFLLSLGALGVVYGDIGTSPLYAVRECFHGEYGIAAEPEAVVGVLSLMVWALIAIVSIKYLTFILRADNHGEGGVIALTAQLLDRTRPNRLGPLVLVGVFAAALLYGDGMITPAISVLSAIEGVSVAAPAFSNWVQPLTVGILVALFALQRFGTQRVGMLFGPVTALWLVTLAILGVRGILSEPSIVQAVLPQYGAGFLMDHPTRGFGVLGAVFLVVTGTEALFADMGHFGRRPIRVAWYALVLPSLLLNYLGQGALLLREPSVASHPFYALAPSWAVVPLIVLATLATIIASQAVISGAYSLTHQAIQLGLLPRMRIVHTSAEKIGQIYIPRVNWILMLGTIGLVLGFQSSSQLAAAYGVAVTGTMTISTILFCVVAYRRWHWNLAGLVALVLAFLIIDISFLSANITKIGHGAWFPLAVGVAVFVMMTTWNKGRALLGEQLYANLPSLEEFTERVAADPPVRVSGNAVFMAGSANRVPPALMHNLRHNKVLHERVAVLTVSVEDVPRIAREEKVAIEHVAESLWRVTARIGYMEEPSVPYLLALAQEQGFPFGVTDTVFFLGRERILPDRHPLMSRWREAVFSFLSLNAVGATRYFKIPPEQVVELGAQVRV